MPKEYSLTFIVQQGNLPKIELFLLKCAKSIRRDRVILQTAPLERLKSHPVKWSHTYFQSRAHESEPRSCNRAN